MPQQTIKKPNTKEKSGLESALHYALNPPNLHNEEK